MKIYYFFSTFCFTRALTRQIEYKSIITKEGSAKIVIFITIGAGGLMLGRGCKGPYSELIIHVFIAGSVYMGKRYYKSSNFYSFISIA